MLLDFHELLSLVMLLLNELLIRPLHVLKDLVAHFLCLVAHLLEVEGKQFANHIHFAVPVSCFDALLLVWLYDEQELLFRVDLVSHDAPETEPIAEKIGLLTYGDHFALVPNAVKSLTNDRYEGVEE